MNAVEVENLSKVYRFYKKPVYRLLEAIARKPMHTAFSALKDIGFTLPVGETLGIIGENGAGKSTLLKILARTLSPSSGHIHINGRVSALLELGAGFHQEFTGKQNIYLNASLMGMDEKEIKAKEEEIIDFADIGDFIDRPIKTYSSGMVVRLAFSIATSVDPDILVVDEALSVGDQRFQEKCIQRMQGFREKNKTIIVCSHSMYLINTLCCKCLWIDHGQIRQQGMSNEIVSRYVAFLEKSPALKNSTASGNKAVKVLVEDIAILGENGEHITSLRQFSTIKILVRTKCLQDNFTGHIAVILEDQTETTLFSAFSRDVRQEGINFSKNDNVTLILPRICLQKGNIYFKTVITDEHSMRIVERRRVGPVPTVSTHPEYGLLWMEHQWRI